jgi:flagellar M-ring protein FliF
MRPVMRRFDQITEVPEPPPAPEPGALDPAQLEAERIKIEEAETQVARGYRENLAMAKTLARDDPRVVANVVKAWVGANE